MSKTIIGEFDQVEVKLDGVKYKLQMPSASWYMDYVDGCKGDNGNLKTGQYIGGLIEAVVIEPKGLSIDNFTGQIRQLRKLSGAIENFIMGDEIEQDKEEIKNVPKPTLIEKSSIERG